MTSQVTAIVMGVAVGSVGWLLSRRRRPLVRPWQIFGKENEDDVRALNLMITKSVGIIFLWFGATVTLIGIGVLMDVMSLPYRHMDEILGGAAVALGLAFTTVVVLRPR